MDDGSDLTDTDLANIDAGFTDPGTDPGIDPASIDLPPPSTQDPSTFASSTGGSSSAPASDSGGGLTLQSATAGVGLLASVAGIFEKLSGGSGSSSGGSATGTTAVNRPIVGGVGSASIIPGVNNQMLIAGGLGVAALMVLVMSRRGHA